MGWGRKNRNGGGLSDANVPPDWIERHRWLDWDDAPRNVIAGEASYTDALTQLAGKPCPSGYCFAVPVTLIREPDNSVDSNAFRAEVVRQHVGYLRAVIAEQIADPLDAVGCTTFTVAGVVRGGSHQAPNLGCHVWLPRRITAGPAISFDDDQWVVSWPPRDDELFDWRDAS